MYAHLHTEPKKRRRTNTRELDPSESLQTNETRFARILEEPDYTLCEECCAATWSSAQR